MCYCDLCSLLPCLIHFRMLRAWTADCCARGENDQRLRSLISRTSHMKDWCYWFDFGKGLDPLTEWRGYDKYPRLVWWSAGGWYTIDPFHARGRRSSTICTLHWSCIEGGPGKLHIMDISNGAGLERRWTWLGLAGYSHRTFWNNWHIYTLSWSPVHHSSTMLGAFSVLIVAWWWFELWKASCIWLYIIGAAVSGVPLPHKVPVPTKACYVIDMLIRWQVSDLQQSGYEAFSRSSLRSTSFAPSVASCIQPYHDSRVSIAMRITVSPPVETPFRGALSTPQTGRVGGHYRHTEHTVLRPNRNSISIKAPCRFTKS